MDATSLPKVKMPNRDGFVADPRPDVLPFADQPLEPERVLRQVEVHAVVIRADRRDLRDDHAQIVAA